MYILWSEVSLFSHNTEVKFASPRSNIFSLVSRDEIIPYRILWLVKGIKAMKYRNWFLVDHSFCVFSLSSCLLFCLGVNESLICSPGQSRASDWSPWSTSLNDGFCIIRNWALWYCDPVITCVQVLFYLDVQRVLTEQMVLTILP